MSKRARHASYPITYHFVWCPMYRRPVLEGEVPDRLAELLPDLICELEGAALESVIRRDPVQLWASVPPTLAPVPIAFRLKGATRHALRAAFAARKRRLPSRWTRRYDVGTAGQGSSETIRKYIEAQKGQ